MFFICEEEWGKCAIEESKKCIIEGPNEKWKNSIEEDTEEEWRKSTLDTDSIGVALERLSMANFIENQVTGNCDQDNIEHSNIISVRIG